MVLDDETVDRLRVAAAQYGMEVEELMVALLQLASERIDDLLGDPPPRTVR
jgi:plasmid stability protein